MKKAGKVYTPFQGKSIKVSGDYQEHDQYITERIFTSRVIAQTEANPFLTQKRIKTQERGKAVRFIFNEVLRH